MQIAPLAPGQAHTPSPVPPHSLLGIVDVARKADAFLFAGNQLGQETGYASLRNAIVALQRLTAGDAAAGFVTHDAGRFFAHGLATSNRADTRDALAGYHLGRSWRNERGVRLLPSILAVVDGAAILRNDTAKTQISERDLKLRQWFD